MQPAENIKQHVHHTNPQNQMSTLYSPGGTLSKDEQATITRDEDATIRREFIPHSASTTGTLLKALKDYHPNIQFDTTPLPQKDSGTLDLQTDTGMSISIYIHVTLNKSPANCSNYN